MRIKRSSEILENVPLGHLLSRLLKHLVPVFHLNRTALGTECDLTCKEHEMMDRGVSIHYCLKTFECSTPFT